MGGGLYLRVFALCGCWLCLQVWESSHIQKIIDVEKNTADAQLWVMSAHTGTQTHTHTTHIWGNSKQIFSKSISLKQFKDGLEISNKILKNTKTYLPFNLRLVLKPVRDTILAPRLIMNIKSTLVGLLWLWQVRGGFLEPCECELIYRVLMIRHDIAAVRSWQKIRHNWSKSFWGLGTVLWADERGQREREKERHWEAKTHTGKVWLWRLVFQDKQNACCDENVCLHFCSLLDSNLKMFIYTCINIHIHVYIYIYRYNIKHIWLYA